MKKFNFLQILFMAAAVVSIISCGPSIKTTASWVNKDKLPAQPVKSVFIIALTDNLEIKTTLENDLAAAAEARGIKAYKSMDVIGPVKIKEVAPHREVFDKKLADLGCETIFTIALVDEKSETKYVPGTTTGMYMPTAYGGIGGYGGFGGYYGYSSGLMASPGYYATDKTYFLESKLFDVKTEELLMSVQSKAANPPSIKSSSRLYTQTLMEEVKRLGLLKK